MESPLTECSPESLEQLFDRDPITYSDADVDRIIERLRADRVTWLGQEQKKQANKGVRKIAPPAQLNLDMLDIKL